MTSVAAVRKRMRVKTCQTLRTISEAGGGVGGGPGAGEQKINPVHYLQPTSYQVTSLRENIINLPTNNSRTLRLRQECCYTPILYPTDKQKHLFTHNGKYYSVFSILMVKVLPSIFPLLVCDNIKCKHK